MAESETIPFVRNTRFVRLTQWIDYLRQQHKWIQHALPYYQSKTTRRLRLESYKRKYKALDLCCRRIVQNVNEEVKPVVAFGHNQCTSGFEYASAPCQGLKRRLQQQNYAHVVEVDEYATSQHCCYCHNRMKDAVCYLPVVDCSRSIVYIVMGLHQEYAINPIVFNKTTKVYLCVLLTINYLF